jgi:excisionase family DNA binding protein
VVKLPKDAEKPAAQTFTRKEVAKMLNLGTSTLDYLTKTKKIASCRVGRRILYLPHHIEDFLKSVEVRAK